MLPPKTIYSFPILKGSISRIISIPTPTIGANTKPMANNRKKITNPLTSTFFNFLSDNFIPQALFSLCFNELAILLKTPFCSPSTARIKIMGNKGY